MTTTTGSNIKSNRNRPTKKKQIEIMSHRSSKMSFIFQSTIKNDTSKSVSFQISKRWIRTSCVYVLPIIKTFGQEGTTSMNNKQNTHLFNDDDDIFFSPILKGKVVSKTRSALCNNLLFYSDQEDIKVKTELN